jgi:hypothetical protein
VLPPAACASGFPAALPIPGVKISHRIRVGWIRAGALGFEVIGDHHKLFTSSNFLKFLAKGERSKMGSSTLSAKPTGAMVATL